MISTFESVQTACPVKSVVQGCESLRVSVIVIKNTANYSLIVRRTLLITHRVIQIRFSVNRKIVNQNENRVFGLISVISRNQKPGFFSFFFKTGFEVFELLYSLVSLVSTIAN